jgi:hypothetical protein
MSWLMGVSSRTPHLRRSIAILAGLTGALTSRLRGNPDGWRPESGSGAVPRSAQRATSRIPDALIRCGEHRRVMFEVISPSELRNWTQRDAKRRDLQAVGGAQGDRRAVPGRAGVAHLPPPARRHWSFEAQGGPDAILQLPSVGLAIPLSEIYTFAELSEPGADDPAADTRG